MIVDSELSLIRQESYVAPVPDNTEEPNEEPVTYMSKQELRKNWQRITTDTGDMEEPNKS